MGLIVLCITLFLCFGNIEAFQGIYNPIHTHTSLITVACALICIYIVWIWLNQFERRWYHLNVIHSHGNINSKLSLCKTLTFHIEESLLLWQWSSLHIYLNVATFSLCFSFSYEDIQDIVYPFLRPIKSDKCLVALNRSDNQQSQTSFKQ